MDEHPSFALLLRRYRQAAGLTQEALAERAHLSARTVSDLERGLNLRPRKDSMALLAEALALPQAERAQFEATARRQLTLPTGDPVAAPAREQHRARPTNLPRTLTSFIGRERDQVVLARLLQEAPLLTLTGTGGCGKTRLALAVAGARLAAHADGVWLVELAPVSSPSLVAQAVATVLGVHEEAGRPLPATLAAFMRSRQLLLMLDNCEHLLQACAELATALLRACPELHILATSREPLGIDGERAWRVPSLALPDARLPQTTADLAAVEAVQLFVARAQAARPGFALTAQNAALVAQMCARLDGIPLALELAAARLSALSLESLAARLDDRFRLLTGGSRTALPRQQTLRATLDWSYALLGEVERAVLRRLAVFAGGWSLEAAEAVCAEQGLEAWQVVDLLAGLVNKSLVVLEEAADRAGDGCRYRLLETVRQYAAERLADSAEAAAVRDHHLRWWLAQAERAEPAMRGREQVAWLARLEADLDNLRAALLWAQETGQATRGLYLATALGVFWDKRSHRGEGRRWLETFVALAAGDGTEEATLRANALHWAARLTFLQSDHRAARALAEQSLAVQRELANPAGLAAALSMWGMLAAEMAADESDVLLGVAAMEESVVLRRQIGEPWGLADALHLLGNVERWRNPERALPLIQECLAIYRDLGHPWDIAGQTLSMGMAAWEQGDLEQAERLFAESLALFRDLGDKRGIANLLAMLGAVAFEQRDPPRAVTLCDESLAVAHDLGDGGVIAFALLGVGVAAYGQRQLERAETALAESLALYRARGMTPLVGFCLAGLAAVACGQGRARRAAQLAGASEGCFGRGSGRIPRVVNVWNARTADVVRAALGEEGCAAAWAEGQTLPLETVIVLVPGHAEGG